MNTEETLSVSQVPNLQQTTDVEMSATSPMESEALRKKRIDDFQRDALADPDSLQANLGAVNGSLMRMSHYMETSLEAALTTIADPVERFERLGPAISMLLQVVRQIDRLAQLNSRLSVLPTKPK